MSEFQTLIQNCDQEIREGRSQNAIKLLSALNTASVPREFRLRLATLCRRVGLHTLGMRLLSPLVHADRAVKERATPAELAEYGVLLVRIDAVDEAQKILENISPEQIPETLLYRAFAHFTNWECEAAVPLLSSYVARPLEPYARFVGQVNLAYALVECRMHEKAFGLLEDNIRIARDNKYAKLLSVSHVYRARLHVQNQDYEAAKSDLQLARSALVSGNSADHLMVDKWRLIIDALESKSIAPLNQLKKLARQHSDWEAIREADLFLLKIQFDLPRFLHLIFGTRFAEYRKRICQEIGSLPDRDTYVLGAKNSSRLDLRTGEIDGHPALKPGRKSHRLLQILLRDFYQPIRIGGLFFELFPNEHFDIFSSPNRVHQTLHRTRAWLEEHNIPLAISEENGFYSAALTGAFSLRIPLRSQLTENPQNLQYDFERLARHFGLERKFTSREAGEFMQVSRQTLQRIFNWALEHNRVERIGRSTSTTYQILPASRKPALKKPA